ncbi:hypothetical protein CCP2SC5_880018 [Azospirillaceae bacterium]
MKIKVGKFDQFFFDAEHGRICNGEWALVLSGNIELSDKLLAGAIAAGRSFSSKGGNINFEAKIPDLTDIMEKGWGRERGEYVPADATGWSYSMGYRGVAVAEYRAESGETCYIRSDYSEIINSMYGTKLYISKNNPEKTKAYFLDADEHVAGVFMPCSGPEVPHK